MDRKVLERIIGGQTHYNQIKKASSGSVHDECNSKSESKLGA